MSGTLEGCSVGRFTVTFLADALVKINVHKSGFKGGIFYFLLVITKFTEFDWFCTTTQLRDNVTSVIAQRPTSYGSFAYEKTLL